MLKKEIAANNKKIVVLDDDPTGVQTVHDISVYTNWEKASIKKGFEEENNLFYILTNSRGFTVEQTTKAHKEIAAVVDEVAKKTGKEYIFISRSDSTLRGHYPLETQLLKADYEKNTGAQIDGEILCPFFKEGGRFTIDNVHYVKYGDELIPANETEFAKDKTFGYIADTMPGYVEEKTNGEYKAADVTCISLEDIHNVNIDKIQEQLMSVKNFQKIIVNAVDYVDIKVFCVALYRAMAKGKVFMFRTAAAIVKVMGGVTDQPLLTRTQMVVNETTNGGIIIVGSHTDKTTKQVESLKELPDIEFIELDATLVKDDKAFEAEVQRCLAKEEECIKAGKTVCCYTTRTLITADTGDKEDELRLSVKISDAVQSLVGKLTVTPAFVIAKGGITSSDVGTKALAVQKANVLGQIKPGIPVWQTGEESKFPQTPYVIFPGNVGEISTLKEAVEVLTK
ncbi:MAG: four-carbon acid sugar kinase family protein [Lachnospiraceae bacterium]|nr:four-carbon acid sugar kinase family protein [Lachnospiraceae bacterium]